MTRKAKPKPPTRKPRPAKPPSDSPETNEESTSEPTSDEDELEIEEVEGEEDDGEPETKAAEEKAKKSPNYRNVTLFRAIAASSSIYSELAKRGSDDVPLEGFGAAIDEDVIVIIESLKLFEGLGLGAVVHGRKGNVLRWVWTVDNAKAVLDGEAGEFTRKKVVHRQYERRIFKCSAPFEMPREDARRLAKHLGLETLTLDDFRKWAKNWVEQGIEMLRAVSDEELQGVADLEKSPSTDEESAAQ